MTCSRACTIPRPDVGVGTKSQVVTGPSGNWESSSLEGPSLLVPACGQKLSSQTLAVRCLKQWEKWIDRSCVLYPDRDMPSAVIEFSQLLKRPDVEEDIYFIPFKRKILIQLLYHPKEDKECVHADPSLLGVID